MIPGWVLSLDDYLQWLTETVDRIEAFGGVLQAPDFLVVTDEPDVGIHAGVGETLTIMVEQNLEAAAAKVQEAEG